jgi:proteasome accessory factor C
VGWLARVGEAPLAEVASRFGLSEEEVVRELELAACCGLPPYTPDVLMEIEVTETTVRTFLPAQLARARRLTPAEGFALSAAAHTILAVPGADHDGALARALDKLDAVLGDHGGLVVELERPELLDEVRSALDEHQRIEIEYYSASSDALSTREVDPIRVLTLEGHWYLDAQCQRAGGVRRFRVDRIRSVRVVGAAPDRPDPDLADGTDGTAFIPSPTSRRVRLAVTTHGAWLVDTVPVVERVDRADGTTEMALDVGGVAWLERLLLQLGPEAMVIEPAEWRSLGANTARRVLDLYEGAN